MLPSNRTPNTVGCGPPQPIESARRGRLFLATFSFSGQQPTSRPDSLSARSATGRPAESRRSLHGRICYQRRKVNVSQVFAGQKVGVRQTDDHIWLVTFMDYDLGYFDDETCRLEPIDNPFGSKLLPMSPE
jgi:hypothetical protein